MDYLSIVRKCLKWTFSFWFSCRYADHRKLALDVQYCFYCASLEQQHQETNNSYKFILSKVGLLSLLTPYVVSIKCNSFKFMPLKGSLGSFNIARRGFRCWLCLHRETNVTQKLKLIIYCITMTVFLARIACASFYSHLQANQHTWKDFHSGNLLSMDVPWYLFFR